MCSATRGQVTGSSPHLLVAGLQVAVPDVVEDGVIEEHRVLHAEKDTQRGTSACACTRLQPLCHIPRPAFRTAPVAPCRWHGAATPASRCAGPGRRCARRRSPRRRSCGRGWGTRARGTSGLPPPSLDPRALIPGLLCTCALLYSPVTTAVSPRSRGTCLAPEEQARDCRFATARGAHEGDCLAARHSEAHLQARTCTAVWTGRQVGRSG
jgi:hypothetical protein